MKTTSWSNFRVRPQSILGTEKVKVKFGDGSYFVATYYTPIAERKGKRIRKGIERHECYKCSNLDKVRFVVPFDANYMPGYYCLKCRKKYDILDIRDAKRYGKIS